MSGSCSRKSREFSQDGVYVQQTYSEDDFDVPAVRIHVESRLEDPVRVELKVTLPESESVDRVGFHPDYDPDNWSIDDNTISYRTRLSPTADVKTVYAVQGLASEDGSVFLDNLTLEVISEIESEKNDDGVESDEPVGELGDNGNSEGDEGQDTEWDDEAKTGGSDESSAGDAAPASSDAQSVSSATASGAKSEPASADVTGPHAEVESQTDEASSADADLLERSDESTIPPTDGDGLDPDKDLRTYSESHLIDELIRRLDTGNLSTKTQQQRRSRFETGESASGAGLEQRVVDLQRRVSDIEAFSTSVEVIHEQHGPPAEVIDETTAELAEVDQKIDGLEERVDTLDSSGEDIESRIASVEADVESLQSDIAEIKDRLDSAASERNELESKVSELADWREQFMGSLTDLGGE